MEIACQQAGGKQRIGAAAQIRLEGSVIDVGDQLLYADGEHHDQYGGQRQAAKVVEALQHRVEQPQRDQRGNQDGLDGQRDIENILDQPAEAVRIDRRRKECRSVHVDENAREYTEIAQIS